MTRREEIQQAILENGIDYCEEHPEMNMNLKEAFVMGAVWADKTMIEKAAQWLYDHLTSEYQGAVLKIVAKDKGKMPVEFVEEFKKAMQE